MQPRSEVTIDRKEFQLIKRTVRNATVSYRNQIKDPTYKTPIPQSLGIKLTNRCNLRCTHCFQWNEDGYHHQMDKAEQNMDLDPAIFKQLLDDTKEAKSRLYLWGGEPMFHRQFGQILEYIQNDRREMTICTNGLLIDKFLEPILDLSENLELLIAVEGFEYEHNLIRGKGTFQKTMAQIDRLVELRDQGLYKGRISVHAVINDNMIGRMTELLEFFESKKLDLVMLCFPWYISRETSLKMDTYFSEKFQWLRQLDERHISSWHAFKYKINPDRMDALMEDLHKINDRIWKIRVRYQPGLDYDEIDKFIHGDEMTSRCSNHCLALTSRTDIVPDGSVMPCKFFSEFTVGNLKEKSLKEIWDSEEYENVRHIINKEGLTPACSKCSVLYLHGAGTVNSLDYI
ncbi:radical SAM protein [Paenibacillus sp. PsM32]|uniref:Radical SAM/SPASM domain-containing protein n=1 Tax=Paenibacillus nicotianae TaxID=1526551 RepID=A0ABW4UW07_9BACL|nr:MULTISPECIES: radical SAM protein [unclassified Paenibacillus]MDN4616892.1 radical SAM protein [Paenibacillus sp. PsM32]MDQ1233266.1 radical SAM protein with 4Fe4S-binding SPASM domain [Paenibacillus sp. SORGH_AS_0306]MDR6110309.1 radical SAM protein with 4Fe4S-binding SPASM domain [Paenibacillus sp. SORGH_AS_0338]WDF49635.1 radical SAM protein [Paenibacillus sp. KACC 21273]